MTPNDDEMNLTGNGPSRLAASWGLMPVQSPAQAMRHIGVDNGRGDDVTAVAVRSGNELVGIHTFSNPMGPGHDLIRDTVDHALQQQELLREIASQARERGLVRPIPTLLSHSIRWALDTSIPLDELALLKLADHHGMQILAKCRAHGVARLLPSVWKVLREHLPQVWGILMYERHPF